METSQKDSQEGAAAGPSAPPPNPIDPVVIDPQVAREREELQRYRGAHAPLGAIAGQLRRATTAGDAPQIAAISARLARQFARRGIELREAVGLAERSLELSHDPSLSIELSQLWVTLGDYTRASRALLDVVGQVPKDKRSDIYTRAGIISAHGGRMATAIEALHHAVEADSANPEPLEALGALGFWADFPVSDASQAFLRASKLRETMGNDARSFENLLSAFEVDPLSEEAAEALVSALRRRGREGAADEILREHLRHGSATRRAAHYERTFYSSLDRRNWALALDSAWEAELDVDLDCDRLAQLLSEPPERVQDFEGLLVHLSARDELGPRGPLSLLLLCLLELHTADWGAQQVARLRRDAESVGAAESPERVPVLAKCRGGETHSLRAELPQREAGTHPAVDERLRIAWAEASRGNWRDVVEVVEPALVFLVPGVRPEDSGLPIQSVDATRLAALGLVAAGRARAPRVRALALALLAEALPAPAATVTFAVASEALSEQGCAEQATEAATRAVGCDPTSQRAIAAQALVALRHPEVAPAALVESSLAVLVARGRACSLLARSASERGAHRLALTWAQRQLVLRPGDPSAAIALLSCARRSGDAKRLQSSIVEVLGRAVPFVEVAAEVAIALDALVELDAEVASEVAHRVLEAMGTRFADVTEALGRLVEATGSQRLRADILERRVALAPSASRAPLLLELADARRQSGDVTSASRALRRAMARGAEPELVRERLRALGLDLEPDATLSQLEARVTLLAKLDPEDTAKRAELLRRLGAARWDMAEDPEGAIEAWLRAADLEPQHGLERFARVLRLVAGDERAAVELEQASRLTDDPKRQARLLGLAGRARLDLGQSDEAFNLAQAALERSPEVADLLALAEKSVGDRLEALEEVYQEIARATLGRYGERAVHYRAARFFESRQEYGRALGHAIAAFEAVPAEGVAFVLMLRLADRTDSRPRAIEAIERLAGSLSQDEERGRWFAKAASLAEESTSGLSQRVDILLRAAQVRLEAGTIESLDQALAELLEAEPGARDDLLKRFRAVAREGIDYASGAHGATVAIGLARVALTRFQDFELGGQCLATAIACDIELPEYRSLNDLAAMLATAPEVARRIIFHTREASEQEGAPLGRGLAEFAGSVAHELGDDPCRAELLVRAASDAPEDVELATLAGRLAKEVGRPDLLEIVEDLLPIAERARAWEDQLPTMSAEAAIEALATMGIEAADLPLRVNLLTKLARLQEGVGQYQDAVLTWRELRDCQPDNAEALAGLERLAQRHSDHEELARVLRTREDLQKDVDEKRRIRLRRAVVLETKLGRPVEARTLLQEALESSEDWTVLRLLADSWERSQDHDKAAELWLRARALAPSAQDAADAGYRAAKALHALGQAEKALELLVRLELENPSHELRELQLALAQETKNEGLELQARVGLAKSSTDSEQAAEHYFEAAKLALDLGELPRAEEYAAAASRGGGAAAARLLAAQLRIRSRPLATRKQARELIEQLEGTESVGGAGQRELRAFLLGEARAVEDGLAAAVTELEAAIDAQGERALLCASLAEKLTDPVRALSLFELAIGGELHGMRREGDLLLQAAEVARKQGLLDRARAFASAVADDDPRRPDAARELEQIAVERTKRQRIERQVREARDKSVQEARRAEETRRDEEQRAQREREEERRRSEAERAESERRAELERRRRAAEEQEVRELAEWQASASEPPPVGAVVESAASGDDAEDLEAPLPSTQGMTVGRGDAADGAGPAQLAPPVPPKADRLAGPGGASSSPASPSSASSLPASQPPASEPGSSKRHHLPSAPAREVHAQTKRRRRRLSSRRLSIHPGDIQEVEALSDEEERLAIHLEDADEEALVTALEGGDFDAGLRLVDAFANDRTRTRDAVIVAGHLARMRLDASSLGRLVDVAVKDGNEPLALAVRHVLGRFGAGEEVRPPPSSELEEEPEAARALLTRGLSHPASDSVRLVWDQAQHLFRRDPADYGVSGVERVPLTAPTPLGELYRSAAGILGATRTPVFRGKRDREGAIRMTVALLSPPAVVVGGEIPRDSPELTFHFGAMLAAAAPEQALLFGLEPEELEELLEALLLAFGRPDCVASPTQQARRLAALLWESVPPRIQRRLSGLCQKAEDITSDAALAHSRIVLRRAGLIACGDLGLAVADAAGEGGVEPPRTLSGLAELSSKHPGVADIVDLALSPEYAELRFAVRSSSSMKTHGA